MNVSNRILLNAAECHGYGFSRFFVIMGKPTGGYVKLPPPPPHAHTHTPRLGLKRMKESSLHKSCLSNFQWAIWKFYGISKCVKSKR